jgi:anti-sigma B factor antagonist
MPQEDPDFHAELQWLGQHLALIDVDGEIDLYTSPELKKLMVEALETGAEHIVADFRHVTFVDSTALGVLLTSARKLRWKKGSIDIVCDDAGVLGVFATTGLDKVFCLYPTREAALAQLAS